MSAATPDSLRAVVFGADGMCTYHGSGKGSGVFFVGAGAGEARKRLPTDITQSNRRSTQALLDEPEGRADQREAGVGQPKALAGHLEALWGQEKALAGQEKALMGHLEALSGQEKGLAAQEKALWAREKALAGQEKALLAGTLVLRGDAKIFFC